MAETYDNRKVYSLQEVTRSIQRTIAERYTSVFWVKAEMNKLNHYSHSGHCYPDLVEKKDGRVIAQMRASLWRDDYRRVNGRFMEVLGEPLRDGITILFSASIHFDPLHGLSLRVIDIDPVYSLGELEREKQESIRRLVSENIFDSNRRATLPLLPQRIAVISVETSKGYSDYLKVIEQNPWGYRFFNMLFPSLLQGDKSVASIITQLNRIRKVLHHFDAVAIIRGGGGDVGLSSYNNYELAKEVALFPLPVFTGIGHSTNETVVEMVSYKNAITPTELADFMIQRFHDFAVPLKRNQEIVIDHSQRIIRDERGRLSNFVRYFQSRTHNSLLKSRHSLESCSASVSREAKFLLRKESDGVQRMFSLLRVAGAVSIERKSLQLNEAARKLPGACLQALEDAKQVIASAERHISLVDPVNILKRGFSITYDGNGKAVMDAHEVKPGDRLTTIFANGSVESIADAPNTTAS